ncbi:MAG: Glu/Leu/Phe/Val dehydrogenase dimerization domain-containing protein [Patescibacteria group bacterium]
MADFDIAKLPEFDRHEMVSCFQDQKTGLKGYIAIHNTNIGPATGGTRMYEYASDVDALRDVLLLSKAMTYKCALAGVKFGGGKAVIICNPKNKTKELLRTFGKKVNYFGGMFTTGTDAGISDQDATLMASSSKYILGQENGIKKAHTSDMAALGVYYGIKTCFEELYGSPDPAGKTIAIKGLGKLGGELARLLLQDDANIIGAETDKDVVMAIKNKFPKITFVSHEDIHKQVCDLYSPCALGNDLTPKVIRELRTKAIAGGANNQLATSEIGYKLHEMGILYAPDYVANAGGLINIVDELEKNGYQRKRVQTRIKKISKTLRTIFALAKQKSISTHLIADQMAENIFKR